MALKETSTARTGRWLTSPRLAAIALALPAALAIGACGGSLAPPVRTAPAAAGVTQPDIVAASHANGRLARRGSPGAAVMDFVYYVKLGAVPEAVDSFYPPVVRAMGVGTLAGILRVQQPTARNLQPSIASVRTRGRSALVIMSAAGAAGAARDVAFSMRHIGGRWQIVYDAALVPGIEEFTRLQRGVAPGDPLDRPTQRAIQRRLAAYTAAASRIGVADLAAATSPQSG